MWKHQTKVVQNKTMGMYCLSQCFSLLKAKTRVRAHGNFAIKSVCLTNLAFFFFSMSVVRFGLYGEVYVCFFGFDVWIKSLVANECVCVFSCMYVCERGGAHGCFLWENGRSGVRGQCLRGSQWG